MEVYASEQTCLGIARTDEGGPPFREKAYRQGYASTEKLS